MNKDPLVMDVSMWRIGDKAWEKERKAKWPMIEAVLLKCRHKSNKTINVIKNYYFEGKLPNWTKLNDQWEEQDKKIRHLDIATLLWLHPSDDVEVLSVICQSYFAGFGRVPQDVLAGMFFLEDWGTIINSKNGVGPVGWKAKCYSFEGKEKLLFDLLYGVTEGAYFRFGENPGDLFPIEIPNLSTLSMAARWLCYEAINDHGRRMLLQYDFPLEVTFKVMKSCDRYTRYMIGSFEETFAKSFYQILNFDTDEEGDTPRTHFALKARKILEEGDHLPEVKQLWEKVKNNEIKIKNPWKL